MDYALADVDFARDELPDLEAQLAALIEAGQRVVPVRYLGGHGVADPAPRGRGPRLP